MVFMVRLKTLPQTTTKMFLMSQKQKMGLIQRGLSMKVSQDLEKVQMYIVNNKGAWQARFGFTR